RHLGEERVVLPAADVIAREELRAALPHDDRAAGHDLAREDLHAEALGIRVASVAGGTLTLLVCHRILAIPRSLRCEPVSWSAGPPWCAGTASRASSGRRGPSASGPARGPSPGP